MRAAAPHTAPARMPGVYAQGLCKDAKPAKHTQPFTGERGQFGMDAEIRTHQALHEAKPSECPKGDRDNKSEVNFKNRLFLQSTKFLYRNFYLYFFYPIQCVSVFTANNYHGGENLEEQLSEKELADLKAKELDILVKFDRMCKENNLRYFITAGTLLGAVRHKGFIPWDDDIDVVMLRKDFNRLNRVCSKALPEGLFLQDKKNDKGYPFHFDKIRLDNTEVIDPFLEGVNMHKGIYIDVFPVDKCPENNKLAQFMFKWVSTTSYALIAKQNKDFDFDYTKKSARMLYHFMIKMPRGFVIAMRDFVVGIFNVFCSGKKLCTVSGAHGFPRETYKSEWFEEKIMLPFESGEYPAPKGYDSLLTNMYGDYMKPPEDDEKSGHFTSVESDK